MVSIHMTGTIGSDASALLLRAETTEAGRPIVLVGNGGYVAPDLMAIVGLQTVRNSAPH